MFLFIFDSLKTSVTFDTSVTEDPSKMFCKEDISNFHLISITQNCNFHHVTGFYRSHHIFARHTGEMFVTLFHFNTSSIGMAKVKKHKICSIVENGAISNLKLKVKI